MDGCSEKPSDRPEIEEFEKRFILLKYELNPLIEDDKKSTWRIMSKDKLEKNV